MNTIHYLMDPVQRGLFLPGIVVGLGVAVMCSLLSVLVVLKRLSFIGQGVSHAAFGGVGIAAVLGLAAGGAAYLGVIVLFCLASAWLIAWLSERRGASSDTAIGIVLVTAMSVGAILLHESVGRARSQPGSFVAPPGWESILFGSSIGVTWTDAALAWGVAAGIVAALWVARRPLLFWAYDEASARAFGVPARAMRLMLMVLLTLAIVASMRLAGVVLATALLVLPGATALRLSDRLRMVMILALVIALAGVLGGIVLCFEADWPPGPSIVAVLTALFLLSRSPFPVGRAGA
ncbi:MAG: metal ABC transporter permease [Phycisphaerales bacterium]|nr:metal ABC transporter permease [Phycisphaerales bacterium]